MSCWPEKKYLQLFLKAWCSFARTTRELWGTSGVSMNRNSTGRTTINYGTTLGDFKSKH